MQFTNTPQTTKTDLLQTIKVSGLVMILAILSACSVLGGGEQPRVAQGGLPPTVIMSSPVADQPILVGETYQVMSEATDIQAITRVELVINGEVIWVDANADPQPNTPFLVAQPWQPAEVGTYTVQSYAYNEANVRGQSSLVTVAVVSELPTATPEPNPANVESNTATATLTPLPATNTPEPPPANTATPIPPTATPTAIPTQEPTPRPIPQGTFAPTNFRPEGRFNSIWESLGGEASSLGYPTGPQINNRDFAKQYFSGGIMYWWDNPGGDNLVWVIAVTDGSFQKGDQWHQFADSWSGGGDHSCDATRENGKRGPVRGFGKIWCEHSSVSSQLGNPVEEERGSGGTPPYSIVQFFQGGIMLYNPLNSEMYVLFNSGQWQHFGY